MDLSTLNPQQRAAVEHTDGPLLILAGAGSGKTRVLTVRIAYILQQDLARPEEILAVTFTNKAAGEMKERIAHLLDGKVQLPWMGTFHSICVKILRRDGHLVGLSPNFSIYDPGDQLDMVKQAMEESHISTKDVNPRAVHSHISSAKNEMVGTVDYEQFAQGYFQELVAKIYPAYQKLLKENNAVDFDDLLLLVVQLLRDNAGVREKYQELFKYILVDEYQDTNNVQYIMVNLLAEKHRNICCVGDDDQSIYSFRGANIRNILNFKRDYPDATVVKLEQNYRSTKKILEAAHHVVKKNKQRTDKKLWTENAEGKNILLFTAENESDEARWVVSRIKNMLADGKDAEEIAILYRTNAQSRALEEAFVREAVNYRIVGGVRFYERKEIKDILAYLKIIHNPKDNTSLKRIVNVPRRGIGAKALEELAEMAKQEHLGQAELLAREGIEFSAKPLQKFAMLVSKIKQQSEKLNVVELIEFILDESGYLASLQDGTMENESRIENLKELMTVAAKYMEYEPTVGLTLFLEEVGLLEEDRRGDDSAAVTLMTIHAAKGLEFENVFLVGMEEGLFPHSRVFTDPHELEEERRLAYVAITRAKQNLHLVHADSRVYFGSRQNNMLSRFVEDIPSQLIDREGYSRWEEDVPVSSAKNPAYAKASAGAPAWAEGSWGDAPEPAEVKVGDKVKHGHFGIGRVLAVDDSIVKINFGSVHGVKELAREFAPLEKIA